MAAIGFNYGIMDMMSVPLADLIPIRLAARTIGYPTISKSRLIRLLDDVCTKEGYTYYFNGYDTKPTFSTSGIPRPTLQSNHGLYITIEDVPQSIGGEFIVVFTCIGSSRSGNELLQLFLNNTKEIQIKMR